MNLMTIAYDVASQIRIENIHGLPASEAQYAAPDEETWANTIRNSAPQQWLTVESVIQCLGKDDSVPPPKGIGMFACHVVISSLCQSIMLFRKLYHGDTSSEAYIAGRRRFGRCLRRWQSMCESEPGFGSSVLSPDHPSGPIPFNSSAMLRVAYIRLAADHSSVRGSFAVRGYLPEEQIAAVIASMHEPLPRDAYTCRAALQACLALRVPVQLGFSVIARAGFWAWSVQHALSYFECALLLGRWLQAIHGITELTPDEKGILSLLEQILDASPSRSEASPSADHSRSSAGPILRLFIRLLDTGELTVWGLTPKMGRVLTAWSRRAFT